VKASAFDVTATSASILLRPCWIARLFGARSVVLELVRGVPEIPRLEPEQWITAVTRRRLYDLRHRWLITEALDQRPCVGLPPARAAARSGSFLAPGGGQ